MIPHRAQADVAHPVIDDDLRDIAADRCRFEVMSQRVKYEAMAGAAYGDSSSPGVSLGDEVHLPLVQMICSQRILLARICAQDVGLLHSLGRQERLENSRQLGMDWNSPILPSFGSPRLGVFTCADMNPASRQVDITWTKHQNFHYAQ